MIILKVNISLTLCEPPTKMSVESPSMWDPTSEKMDVK